MNEQKKEMTTYEAIQLKVKKQKEVLLQQMNDIKKEIIKNYETTRDFIQKKRELVEKLKGNTFVLIKVSDLSLDDDFMQYETKTHNEWLFKETITKILTEKTVKDFYRPVLDPSFGLFKLSIKFSPMAKPAVGKTTEWWKKHSAKISRKRGSRLGTQAEYFAFLAVLMKKLIAEGKSIEWTWNAICNDSEELAHYGNNGTYDAELTASREICGFYDLANTYKILMPDQKNGYMRVGSGSCKYNSSSTSPLVKNDFYSRFMERYSVGWIVLER